MLTRLNLQRLSGTIRDACFDGKWNDAICIVGLRCAHAEKVLCESALFLRKRNGYCWHDGTLFLFGQFPKECLCLSHVPSKTSLCVGDDYAVDKEVPTMHCIMKPLLIKPVRTS